MIVFLGEYEVTFDAKGRFLLPVGIKKQLPEDAGDKFVIARGFEKCLTLYPKKNWEPIMAELIKVNDYKAENREFLRYFTMGAAEMELDSAGRLLVQFCAPASQLSVIMYCNPPLSPISPAVALLYCPR